MRSLTAPTRGTAVALSGIAMLATSQVVLAEDGGDDLFTAFVIPEIPYSDTGDTSDNTNFDDVACPFTDSTSPDVWYALEPDTDITIRVALCDSAYDTKTYVYNGSLDLIACNDDGGCGAEFPTQAAVNFTALAGEEYFIIVDGFGGEAGAFDLSVTEFIPVNIDCPVESLDEAEPCGEDLNGGCNMEFPAFGTIACGDVICGNSWYTVDPDPEIAGPRDTDWYEIVTTENTRLIFTGTAEFAPAVGLVATGGSGNCDDATTLAPFATGQPGEAVTIDPCLAPGTHWLFMGPNRGLQPTDVVCGEFNEYYVSLECEPCVPPATECPPSDVELSQSTSQDVVGGNGVACAADGQTTENSFCREFAIETGDGIQEYALVLNIPSTQDLGLPGIWPGTNPDGEARPSYIMASDCAISTFQTFDSIGFPTVHWVANLSLDTSGGGIVATCAEVGLEGGSDEPIIATVSLYRDVNGFPPTSPGFDLVLLGSAELEIGPDTSAQKLAAVFPEPIVIVEPACTPSAGDTNDDGFVDVVDLLAVLGDWGCTGAPGTCPGDTDCSGSVDVSDLLDVLGNWST